MSEIIERISKIGIIPVLALEDANKAVSVANALQNGGIDCAEVTFRTSAAEEAIRRIKTEMPEMLVGAGTVTNIDQIDRALSAGASFIVTPGYNPKVVNYCIEKSVPIVPGCMDTNSIEMALEAGLDTVKFFPAGQAGGVPMMKALSGTYVSLKFVPTGGVNKDNLLEYIGFKKVIAVGGSWMVKGDLINSDRFDEIERLSREAVSRMLNFRVLHIGINNDSEEEAEIQAARFGEIFGFPCEAKTSSIFASEAIEVCRKRFPGVHGHIAVGTGNVERAIYHLSKKGISFDMGTAKYKSGRLSSVYLAEEIGGFAIHLMEKQ